MAEWRDSAGPFPFSQRRWPLWASGSYRYSINGVPKPAPKPFFHPSRSILFLTTAANAEGLEIAAILNAFWLDVAALTPEGTATLRLAPHRFYRGANRLRLLVYQDGERLDDAALKALDLRLQRVDF